ncbi:MAG TPA: DNA mismatch repair endonuclease MutL, partial [Gammaproteobacteria bacterium]|nr:DNA mismatch repair endonuclease MutL [Gammaproteobacteria bacterium]
PRIHLLPSQLANQIAAGEVVERPASVIKELLENSLDAGASDIIIAVSHGGLGRIAVQDNGCGIHPDDMRLALSPHATSKIKSSEDLAQIMSLGFRGEALASISAVSRVTLTSAQQDSPHAHCVQFDEHQNALVLQPAAHPTGCSVEVCDLFYNTPARRKFLRGARSEWQYSFDVIKGILLSRFEVSFTVDHQGKKTYYPAVKNNDSAARIAKVLSPAFIATAQRIDASVTDLHLTGFVAPSDFTRSSSDWQYFYVNGRMVKDKLLQHALRRAFADTLHPGRYPAYVLYLNLDPRLVDVNVHPTKHEVRFQNARWVHDFIVNSVQQVLNVTHTPSALNREHVFSTATYASMFYPQSSYIPQTATISPRKLGRFLTVLNQQIIISETAEGLGLIDLHAYYAHQAYTVMMNSTEEVRRQACLVPHGFKVSPAHDQLLLAQQAELMTLGFIIEEIGEAHWALREMPAVLACADHDELVHTLLGVLSPAKSREQCIAQLACCALPTLGLPLTGTEIERILDNVEALHAQASCPHGLKVWQLWSLAALREAAVCKHHSSSF